MVKINDDARRAITIVFFEPQIFTDLTDLLLRIVEEGCAEQYHFQSLQKISVSIRAKPWFTPLEM